MLLSKRWNLEVKSQHGHNMKLLGLVRVDSCVGGGMILRVVPSGLPLASSSFLVPGDGGDRGGLGRRGGRARPPVFGV